MKHEYKIAVVCLLVAGLAGTGTWYLSKNSKKISPMEMTCLSAVVPSVVLHHEQEQIVDLLQQLANEEKSTAPEKSLVEGKKSIFSERIDTELLKIAELFKIRGEDVQLENADVMSSVTRALSYFKKDAPEYLNGCMTRLEAAKKECGTIENPNETEKLCLEKHAEGINSWAQSFLPDTNS